ncbi:MAG: hypothetical protein H6713_09250 [Myxococcales bacterium]|nr:hypothetical protein [Myxococcales bacterium]
MTTVLDILSTTLAALLREDPRRLLLGEDCRDGGMLGLSRAALDDPELEGRVLGTPLTPASAVAHAGGLALAGRRPIIALPSAAALLEGLAALRELARGGQLAAGHGEHATGDVLLLAPTGYGFGLGGDHAASFESTLALAGARVIALGDTSEAAALLRAAADLDAHSGPVVLLLPRSLLLETVDPDALYESLPRELHAARPVRGGADAVATVFCWGDTVARAIAAAERTGFDVAVVDVASLAPLDTPALIRAARETGKLVIAHSGAPRHGVAAELAALFADEAILYLDAPIVRVAGARELRYPAEADACPSVHAIADAITRVVTY